MDIDNVPVAFNMDLANAPTGVRFCIQAATMLDEVDTLPPDLSDYMEDLGEVIYHWEDRLADAGYCAIWNAGDVVVYDLRALSDDERTVL